MVAIALLCFVLAGLGLLGFNVWYYRALTDARSEADAYWTLARSWQTPPPLRSMRWSNRAESTWRHQIRQDGIFSIEFL